MSRLRWPDSTNSVSEKPGTIHCSGSRVPMAVRHSVRDGIKPVDPFANKTELLDRLHHRLLAAC